LDSAYQEKQHNVIVYEKLESETREKKESLIYQEYGIKIHLEDEKIKLKGIFGCH